MMLLLLFGMVLFPVIAMETEDEVRSRIVTRMEHLKNSSGSPFSRRNKEFEQVRHDINIYFTDASKKDGSMETLRNLLVSAQQTRLDREKREAGVTPLGKAKIVSGGACVLVSMLQFGLITRTWAQNICEDNMGMLGSFLSVASSLSGGVYLIYDGALDTDAQLESAQAAKTELLLLQKYVLLSKDRSKKEATDSAELPEE